MVRIRTRAISGSTECTVAVMLLVIALGSPAVRTAMFAPFLGLCQKGRASQDSHNRHRANGVVDADDLPLNGRAEFSNTGDSLNGREHLLIVGVNPRRFFGTRVRHRKVEGEDVIDLDAEIDPDDVDETMDGEASAGEQRESECEFADDEDAAQAMASGAHTSTSTCLQRFVGVDARGKPSRCVTGEQASKGSGCERNQENGDAKAHISFGRQGCTAA